MTQQIVHVLPTADMWKAEQEAWNERSQFFVNMHERADRVEQVDAFYDFLREENLLPEGAKTLDIGCATADYALKLAQEGCDAYGIDLSDGMIQGAASLAKAKDIPITLYVGAWSEETRQELAWDGTFDLVYTKFCPIMFEADNLKAMHAASRGACVWVAFKRRYDKMVELLFKAFDQPYGSWSEGYEEALETIHAIGRDVKEELKEYKTTETFNLDQAVDYFSMRIRDDSMSRDQVKAKVREVLSSQLVGGQIVNESIDVVAYVTWKK
ncbi:MAG: class I SAM-dependent methyltransferase [Veillonella sp.]|nr:class I SAM-dependent methyltransferase [Veillonella sp.]